VAVLVTLWSPKGGSGTSVVAAALAAVLGRSHTGVRLVDLAGDQPAICSVRESNVRGVGDWLAAGPTTPASALDTLAVDGPDLPFAFLPVGRTAPADASGVAGAALAVVLRDDARITVVDAGLARAPAAVPLVDVADLSLIVVRSCYLALRRLTAREPLVRVTSGVVLVDEPHRSLRTRDVAEVVDLPVLGVVPCIPDVARAVDAGVLLRRAPESLVRAITELTERVGLGERPRRVA
jgi:hypothetical protein